MMKKTVSFLLAFFVLILLANMACAEEKVVKLMVPGCLS